MFYIHVYARILLINARIDVVILITIHRSASHGRNRQEFWKNFLLRKNVLLWVPPRWQFYKCFCQSYKQTFCQSLKVCCFSFSLFIRLSFSLCQSFMEGTHSHTLWTQTMLRIYAYACTCTSRNWQTSR